MLKFNLSKESPTILAFDGEILECFFMDGSKRLHVMHIKGIQLDLGNKGKHMLTIRLKSDPLFMWADEDVLPKVNELIDEVQKAIASFKL